jgi:UDP-glucose 4-epimerase
MKDKILLTGAAGFIGSHLMDYLIDHGYDVIGVDDFSGGFKRNVRQDWQFYRLDISQRDMVKLFIEEHKPNILMHLASSAREGASQFDPFKITVTNYYAYINLLEQMIKHGLKKCITFSSMAIYGNQKPPFYEYMPRLPEDIYGVNKTAMERSTEILSDVHGFEYTIIRPHNVAGVRQSLSDRFRNVIGIFMNRIMRGEPIYIYGDGGQRRAFSYIFDSLSCYEKCINDFHGEIFNIGGKFPITINELAGMVIDCFPGYRRPEIIHLPPRPCEVKYAWCSWEKSEQLLDYRETKALPTWIAEMSTWAKFLGPQEWTDEKLEIVNEKTPITWRDEKILEEVRVG